MRRIVSAALIVLGAALIILGAVELFTLSTTATGQPQFTTTMSSAYVSKAAVERVRQQLKLADAGEDSADCNVKCTQESNTCNESCGYGSDSSSTNCRLNCSMHAEICMSHC